MHRLDDQIQIEIGQYLQENLLSLGFYDSLELKFTCSVSTADYTVPEKKFSVADYFDENIERMQLSPEEVIPNNISPWDNNTDMANIRNSIVPNTPDYVD